MITLVEALNYRCLRYVRRRLKPFHVLVGPNASGKTTFMDVIGFLGNLVSEGLEGALLERPRLPGSSSFEVTGTGSSWRSRQRYPMDLRRLTMKPALDTVRYQVSIGFDDTQRQFEFKAETLLLKKTEAFNPPQNELFPMSPPDRSRCWIASTSEATRW